MRVKRSNFKTTAECYAHFGNTNSTIIKSVCDLIDHNNSKKETTRRNNERKTTTELPPPDDSTLPAVDTETAVLPSSKHTDAFDDYNICRSIYVELQTKSNEQARHYAACLSESRQCHLDYRALFDKTDARHTQTVESERATKNELLVHQTQLDLVNKQLVTMDLANNATAAELRRVRNEKTTLTAEVARLSAIVSVKHTAAEACSADLKSAENSATSIKIQLARVLANHTTPEDYRALCPITHDRLLAYYGIFGLACTLILILLLIAASYAIKHHRLLRRSQALLAKSAGFVSMHDFVNPPGCPNCRATTGMPNTNAGSDDTGSVTVDLHDVNPASS